MALLIENNEQYYSGKQVFNHTGGPVSALTCTFNTELVATVANVSDSNFTVSKNGVLLNEFVDYTLSTQTLNRINFVLTINNGDVVTVKLNQSAVTSNYGSYEYISLNEIINNFMVAYVGKGKIIPDVPRTDVMFHAQRGLQEFSYDTLKSIKSQELTIPPSLSVVIPQDYVNYVKCCWIDDVGAKHIIYPTRVTSNPTEIPVQNSSGIPTQDSFGNNEEHAESKTEERWASQDNTSFDGFHDYRIPMGDGLLGQRYGLQPEEAQINGKFTINERLGKISFSSDLKDKLIILEYISDGLSVDEDMKIPKFAEQAMYMHIAHGILSTRINIPEYIVARFKKDRRAALRNAKIRLSNIKIEEISQVFRNKSKIIKH